MKKISKFGSILVMLAVLLAVAGSVYFTVEHAQLAQWFQAHRLMAMAVGGLVLAGLFFMAYPSRTAEDRTVASVIDREQLSPPQIEGEVPRKALPGSTSSLQRLHENLRATHGYRWRYRQPWLLLTGDNAAIQRLLPGIVEHGWLQIEDAILLWNGAGENGQPDASWLEHVYKLRRRRPVDAVVLVTDGDKDLPTQRWGTDAYGIRLARITEVLRWSAPGYALEVGSTSASSTSDAPVIFCEMPLQVNAPAIEAALQELRDQLSGQSLAQLPQNGRERYLGYLSQRLDSRGRALADWLSGLAGAARRQLPVRGVAFAPAFGLDGSADAGTDLPLWQYLAGAAQRQPGHRTARHPLTIGAWLALSVVGLWTAGMLISGLRNDQDLRT
ncbi:MAG: hypothetical protein JO278_01255, partial [Dyella sp.]|nr:hypothetical protein [Dyella sp.]